MKEVKPSAELQYLLNQYSHIDYVLMESETQQSSEEELHRQAAKFFLETIKRRVDEYADGITNSWFIRLFGWLIGSSRKREHYPQITFEPAKATGIAINLQTLMGFEFCAKNNIPDETSNHVGYWDTFSDPPYGAAILGDTPNEIADSFQAINEQIFGGINANLSIFEWDTDWSNYFDAGHEWWGSYLWTIYNRQTNTWVAIGASQTD